MIPGLTDRDALENVPECKEVAQKPSVSPLRSRELVNTEHGDDASPSSNVRWCM